ncbi:MAG: hypothetical protein IT453_07760 [Planctomycetes bacterium]|nr:hypothetical protein [Planctomycetota bacterium]
MKADGDRIRALVESERARIGRVPATIDTRSDCPFIIRRGGWVYATIDGGTVYELSVGDYFRDGLVLYWQSDSPEWIVDT